MDFVDEIRKSKYLWIYGAGIVSKRVFTFLTQSFIDVSIHGVVVSEKGSYNDFYGYKVHELSEVDTPYDSSYFIIAVSAKYKEEIIEKLNSCGYKNYIFWDGKVQSKAWELCKCYFDDRRRNLAKVCFVLAGYKNFLWEDVFDRLKRFVPSDVEVCILSAGKWDEQLAFIAKGSGWSYLSIELNSVTLIQNMAMRLFPFAKWIYKMDEDIFLTKNAFENVMNAYNMAEFESRYDIGYAAPLIPLNGYGYIHFLEHIGKLEEYDNKFERALCGGSGKRMLENSDEAAAYLWGLKSDIPQLDKLNDFFSAQSGKFSFCNVRFSIGFILFNRSLWDFFGGYNVSGNPDLGNDEEKMGSICMNESYAIVVAEDTVVGHFSFGKQTEYMKKLYEQNREWFAIPKEE